MIPVLTKQQAYKLDKDTIDSGRLNQEQLMDNAGKAVAQFFCEKLKNPFNEKVVVVCGKGNNGGDGIITHSYLKKYNVSSKIVFTESKHGHSNLIKKYKISKSDYSIYNTKTKFDKYDWIIDAIFGIGFSRSLNNKYIKIINEMNCTNQIISIDINSGLVVDGNSSILFVKAQHTITFNNPKLCHYLYSVKSLSIKDVGLKVPQYSNLKVIEFSDIKEIIDNKKSKINIDKYDSKANVIAGSDKFPGAAILSSMSAYKTGSGYVNLLSSFTFNEKISNLIKVNYPDIVVSCNRAYTIPIKQFILFGPGIDNVVSKDKMKYYECDNFEWVIDAGGFLSFDNINEYPENSILTPHHKEFKTKVFPELFRDLQPGYNQKIDISIFKEVQRIISSRIIILKSFNTFIITKDMIYIMDKGPSILATAGTGDVLSGILISLLSQGYSRLAASILGTYLHAEAANYYIENISKDGMTASDLIDCIPYAFNKLREHNVN